MIARLASSLATVTLLVALHFASAAHVEAQEKFTPGEKFTVKDLWWCLSAHPPPIDSSCMVYVLGIAEAARHGEVHFVSERVCWPKSQPISLERVTGIIAKQRKWLDVTDDRRAPAIFFIVTALAEAYPCK